MGELRLLLDTHIFLWWLFDDRRLSEMMRELIADPDHQVLISAASVWEIVTKYRLGKLPDAASVAKDVSPWIIKAGFSALPITPEHAQLAGQWPQSHRDPFDRMLAAQAKIEMMTLVSVDRKLAEFPISILKD